MTSTFHFHTHYCIHVQIVTLKLQGGLNFSQVLHKSLVDFNVKRDSFPRPPGGKTVRDDVLKQYVINLHDKIGANFDQTNESLPVYENILLSNVFINLSRKHTKTEAYSYHSIIENTPSWHKNNIKKHSSNGGKFAVNR